MREKYDRARARLDADLALELEVEDRGADLPLAQGVLRYPARPGEAPENSRQRSADTQSLAPHSSKDNLLIVHAYLAVC